MAASTWTKLGELSAETLSELIISFEPEINLAELIGVSKPVLLAGIWLGTKFDENEDIKRLP